MASNLLCVKSLLPSSSCFANSIIHLGWQFANCSHPLSQDVAAGFFQVLLPGEHSWNICKQQEGLAQCVPLAQESCAELLGSIQRGEFGEITSKIQPWCHKEKGNPKESWPAARLNKGKLWRKIRMQTSKDVLSGN
ncbi:hypothetical protein Nmel_012850 [Mimus melanotis]